jgi:two-component system chemotaxis response regulator CheY
MIKRTITLAELPVANLFEAADGKAALEVMQRGQVDLVLADLNMPGMGGIEMTRIMRSSDATRSIPVIVVSADPNAHRLDDLQNQGIQGYVRKPFTPENVRYVVTQVLGGAHA